MTTDYGRLTKSLFSENYTQESHKTHYIRELNRNFFLKRKKRSSLTTD